MRKTILFALSLLLSQVLTAQWCYSSLQAFTNSVVFVNSAEGFASTGWTLAKTTDGGTTRVGVASAPMDSVFQSQQVHVSAFFRCPDRICLRHEGSPDSMHDQIDRRRVEMVGDPGDRSIPSGLPIPAMVLPEVPHC
jgi:hypothetical protein